MELVNGSVSEFPGNLTRGFGVPDEGKEEALTPLATWGWAFLFVTIINLSSVMGIVFFPLMEKAVYTLIMRAMIGLAIGSLSGSALFHLIPAAFDLQATNAKGQAYINIALFIWLAMWLVLLLECGIKIVVKLRAQKSQSSPYKGPTPEIQIDMNVNQLTKLSVKEDLPSESEEADEEEEVVGVGARGLEPLPVYRSTLSLNKLAEKGTPIKTVAWLVIIGDSLHNFIDGVSIGAGFVTSWRTGAVICLAIMCEEFPHELGDFAILINSGFSVKGALGLNFLSALTCYLGMGMGILLGEIQWANYIFAFAAGIFLYVSLADMIPEVTTLIDEICDVNPWRAWKVLAIHNVGILAGIFILYILAAFQPK